MYKKYQKFNIEQSDKPWRTEHEVSLHWNCLSHFCGFSNMPSCYTCKHSHFRFYFFWRMYIIRWCRLKCSLIFVRHPWRQQEILKIELCSKKTDPKICSKQNKFCLIIILPWLDPKTAVRILKIVKHYFFKAQCLLLWTLAGWSPLNALVWQQPSSQHVVQWMRDQHVYVQVGIHGFILIGSENVLRGAILKSALAQMELTFPFNHKVDDYNCILHNIINSMWKENKRKNTLSHLTGFPEIMFLYKKVFLLKEGNFFLEIL